MGNGNKTFVRITNKMIYDEIKDIHSKVEVIEKNYITKDDMSNINIYNDKKNSRKSTFFVSICALLISVIAIASRWF